MKVRHLDLFSGIGGFALATEMVYGAENVEHIFCDNDPFSQSIIKKHWPKASIHGDIKTLTAKETGRGIDLLTGGFPCQPFSAAGRRLGTEDNRHLWPEMLRIIRETHPTYILGENVGGLLTWDGGLVFKQVCADLESENYEVGAFVIPAVAVGAPHRRDRVWITAHSRHRDDEGKPIAQERREETKRRDYGQSKQSVENVRVGNVAHTANERGQRHRNPRTRRQGFTNDAWAEDWPQVATRLCTLDDGLPNGLARPKRWRNAALKGAGNAIVPQVAAEILRAMTQAL